eukprot:512786-Pleurochrysis_carterae.AAC.1
MVGSREGRLVLAAASREQAVLWRLRCWGALARLYTAASDDKDGSGHLRDAEGSATRGGEGDGAGGGGGDDAGSCRSALPSNWPLIRVLLERCGLVTAQSSADDGASQALTLGLLLSRALLAFSLSEGVVIPLLSCASLTFCITAHFSLLFSIRREIRLFDTA